MMVCHEASAKKASWHEGLTGSMLLSHIKNTTGVCNPCNYVCRSATGNILAGSINMWRQEKKHETKQNLAPPGIREQGMSQSSGICPNIHTKRIFLQQREEKQNPYCVLF